MVTVFLAKALICFSGVCHPALVGDRTPTGEFQMARRHVLSDGYGGDVLQFKVTDTEAFSIHRVWTKVPSQRRRERLASSNPEMRKSISDGCINVDEAVYDKLLECCRNSTLVIR